MRQIRRIGDTCISPIQMRVWTRTATPYRVVLNRYGYVRYVCRDGLCGDGYGMHRTGTLKAIKVLWFYRTITIRIGRG